MKPNSLPWPCLALALLTCGAVFLTAGAGKVPLILPIAVAMAASYVLRGRIPEGPAVLLTGFGLLVAALFLTPDPGDDGPLQIGPARTRNLFGVAASVGMLLQFWAQRPSDPQRAPLYIALFSALAMALSACNTYEEHFARYFLPAYGLLTALTLRTTRPRRAVTARSAVPLVLALAMTTVLGATAYAVILNYRTQITEWGNRLGGDRSESDFSGISDQPMLSATFGQRGSARRILRLEDYRGDGHLRGMSFWRYDGGRWGPPISARTPLPFTGDDVVAPVQGRRGASSRVERLAPDNPIVYAPLSTRSIVFDDVDKVDWNRSDGGPILVKRGGPTVYTIFALGDEGQGLLAGTLDPQSRPYYLEVPDHLRGPLTRVARGAVQGATTPRERIARLEAYLMAKHPYSLRYTPRRGDPVLSFVLNEGDGAHCEFFASAATLMLRCLDIPARYVTGFFAHEEEGEKTTIVRQRDAHAWTEAYLDGTGWVTVEATPPSGMPDVQTAGSGIEWWRAVLERFQDVWSQVRNYLAEMEPEQVVLISLILPGLVGVMLLLRRRRRRLTDDTGYPTPAELAAYARRFDQILSRRGIPAPAHLPWSEHLAGLPDAHLPFAPVAEAFVALYDAARFGSDTDRGALERAIADAESVPIPR